MRRVLEVGNLDGIDHQSTPLLEVENTQTFYTKTQKANATRLNDS